MKCCRLYVTAVVFITSFLFVTGKGHAQTSGPLFDEISRLDSLQFDAFNTRNLDQLMGTLIKTLNSIRTTPVCETTTKLSRRLAGCLN
jgi:hypothetical protein